GRQPVEGRPVDVQPQVGLLLLREAPNRGAVEGEVVRGFQEELLVVIEHVEPAFEIGEAHGDGFDPLLALEVRDALLPDLVRGNPLEARLLGAQVQFLELVVRNGEEAAKSGGRHSLRDVLHVAPLAFYSTHITRYANSYTS